MRTRMVPVLLLVLALAVPSGPAAAFTAKGVGVVTQLQGQAAVQRAGAAAPEPLRFRGDVFWQDVITTQRASLARLLLLGSSIVTVRELTRFELVETALPRGRLATLTLRSGGARVSTAPALLRPDDRLEFRTPNAVAAVRGTDVVVEVAEVAGEPVTEVYVFAGEAEVTPGKQVVGTPGAGLLASAGPVQLAQVPPGPFLLGPGRGARILGLLVTLFDITADIRRGLDVRTTPREFAKKVAALSAGFEGRQVSRAEGQDPLGRAAAAIGDVVARAAAAFAPVGAQQPVYNPLTRVRVSNVPSDVTADIGQLFIAFGDRAALTQFTSVTAGKYEALFKLAPVGTFNGSVSTVFSQVLSGTPSKTSGAFAFTRDGTSVGHSETSATNTGGLGVITATLRGGIGPATIKVFDDGGRIGDTGTGTLILAPGGSILGTFTGSGPDGTFELVAVQNPGQPVQLVTKSLTTFSGTGFSITARPGAADFGGNVTSISSANFPNVTAPGEVVGTLQGTGLTTATGLVFQGSLSGTVTGPDGGPFFAQNVTGSVNLCVSSPCAVATVGQFTSLSGPIGITSDGKAIYNFGGNYVLFAPAGSGTVAGTFQSPPDPNVGPMDLRGIRLGQNLLNLR